MSHAALSQKQIQADLIRIEKLIEHVDHSSTTQVSGDSAELLLEHLNSVRAYLSAAMPDEYAASLDFLRDSSSVVSDRHLRREVSATVSDLLSELSENDRATHLPRHHHPHGRSHAAPPADVHSSLWNFFDLNDTSFGVFYPKNHIVAAFDSRDFAEEAYAALERFGFDGKEMCLASGGEMLDFLEELRVHTGATGKLMEHVSRGFATEEVFVDDDIAMAANGATFLAIYSPVERDIEGVRESLLPYQPSAVQRYLSTGIQRLI